MKKSHNRATKGLLSENLEGSYNIFFCYSKLLAAVSAKLLLIVAMDPIIHSRLYFLKMAMIEII